MYVRPLRRGSGQRRIANMCTCIASPVFSLVIHRWCSSDRWARTLGPCSPDGLQVSSEYSAGFSAGSSLGFLEDPR
jgi:hypothetical protein